MAIHVRGGTSMQPQENLLPLEVQFRHRIEMKDGEILTGVLVDADLRGLITLDELDDGTLTTRAFDDMRKLTNLA